MAPKNPGLTQRFTDDVPADMQAHHPNAPLYKEQSGPEQYALGPMDLAPNSDTSSPSAPEGVVNATTPQSSRRHFTVNDVPQTPSMSGPAATRPRKAEDRALSPAEAPYSAD